MEISYELAASYASHMASGFHFDFLLSRELLDGHVFFGIRNVRPAERRDVLAVSVEPELFDHLALLESVAKNTKTGSAAIANAIESTLEVLNELRAPELVDQARLKKSLDCLNELERKLRKGWKKLRPFERLEQLKAIRHLWYGRFPNSDEACRHLYDRGHYWNPLYLELPEFKQFGDVPEISGLVWQQPDCPPLRVRTADLENLGIPETEAYACAGRNLRQLYKNAKLKPINAHYQLEVGESMEGSFREVAGFWQDGRSLPGSLWSPR